MASHGFATLALAFYDFEDLPKDFNIMEVDYFEEAVCYMLQHPKVLLLPPFSQAPWEYLQRWLPASGVPMTLCSLFMVEVSLGDFLDFEHQHFPFLHSFLVWNSS